MRGLSRIVFGVALLLPARASAQNASCAFDGASATVTITANSQEDITVEAIATGEIRLDGVNCAGATVTTTDAIQINGGASTQDVQLRGAFAPGKTPEADGASEIEIAVAGGGATDSDSVGVFLTDANRLITLRGDGIDVGNDLDVDITTTTTEMLEVIVAGQGDYTIDARPYTGTARPFVLSGDGNDTLYGSSGEDFLVGGGGNDRLYGRGGNDSLQPGDGNDIAHGGPGDDVLLAEIFVDGDDLLDGGEGVDTVKYAYRQFSVTVTLGNNLADDGTPGVEHDLVDVSVENAMGGELGDVLIGDDRPNVLSGSAGDDELYGGGGNDRLNGGPGDDVLVGDAGHDRLYGNGDNDSLDGGAGPDDLWGGPGNDTLSGGAGVDEYHGEGSDDVFFNNDGVAEMVDCGNGIDDPEPDPLDTYLSCEN
jgi:Ca2+-binding RTX toxin-like protein